MPRVVLNRALFLPLAGLALCACTVTVTRSPLPGSVPPGPAATATPVAKAVTTQELPGGPSSGALPSASKVVPQLAVTVVAPTPTPQPQAAPPSRLVISSIGVDAPVVPLGWVAAEGGSRWQEVPDGAIGWHINSATPGQGSNVVLSGHHNIKGQVFRRLAELQPADEVILVAGGQEYRYRVAEVLIIPEKGMPPEQRLQNALWMAPTRRERLTLISCWPLNNNTHRVIVLAYPEQASAQRMAQQP